MKKIGDGRIRRTETEWKKIVHNFLASGLNAKEFCRREKLDRNNLSRWRRQLSTSPGVAKFVPLMPRAKPSAEIPPRSGWELDVSLPGGVHLQFRG